VPVKWPDIPFGDQLDAPFVLDMNQKTVGDNNCHCEISDSDCLRLAYQTPMEKKHPCISTLNIG